MPKSAAQIRRMQKRAEARGEKYEAKEEEPANTGDGSSQNKNDWLIIRLKAAKKLKKTLADIESSTDLKAKERRSATRKAKAIAAEEAGDGCNAETLLDWYEKKGKRMKVEESQEDSKQPAKKKQKKSLPYILFIGQLSYQTTAEGLFKHIQHQVGKDEKTGKDIVTDQTLKIRLLTDDKKKNRSRGMAFVETTNPGISYKLLKLHHTHLDGRRINVERSAGGGKNSDARKEKISSYRKEQEEYMKETVDRIIADHKSKGELDDDELDDGVIALMKRHSAATVEIALAEYVEERGKEMDNPSAYLTSIIGRVAVEGADDNKPTKKDMYGRKNKAKRRGDGRYSQKRRQEGGYCYGSPLSKTSTFAKAGVDMSMSVKKAGGDGGDGDNAMLSIFPSMGRGRGRGAYMGRR